MEEGLWQENVPRITFLFVCLFYYKKKTVLYNLSFSLHTFCLIILSKAQMIATTLLMARFYLITKYYEPETRTAKSNFL